MKRILLPFYGGLGDSLQFSTLPLRYTELGDEVYLSSRATFRNPQIKELVWDLNPWIQGVSDDEPNCGDGARREYQNAQHGFIGNWEYVHDLKPRSKYPDIYYHPQKHEGVKSKILFDPTATSLKEDYDFRAVERWLNRNFKYEDIVMCNFLNRTVKGFTYGGYETINVVDIFDYCDMIHSCMEFVCLFSGGNALASGLQKYGDVMVSCLVSCCPKTEQAKKLDLYFFDNINYVWI